MLRASGAVALIAIGLTLRSPHAGALAGFLLVTIWVNGPLAPLLPATYEPILMLFGRIYPPVLVAMIGISGTIYVEFLNYHLYRKVLHIDALEPLRQSRLIARLSGLYLRAPFFTIWLCSWSPLPYWPVRFLSPLVGYSVRRHLLATLLGRFPRLLFFAALGLVWGISSTALFAITAGSILLAVGVWSYRRVTGKAS